MLRPSISFLLVPCLGALLPAQARHLNTSPADLDDKEGNGVLADVLGTHGDVRYQQVDSTLRSVRDITRRILFRRDAVVGASATYRARTLELTVILSHGDITRFGPDLDKNYVGMPRTMLSKRSVSFPDWSKVPSTAPAAWFGIPLASLWPSNGAQDWLIEVQVTRNSQRDRAYPFDFHRVVPGGSFFTSSAGRGIGTGCIARGRSAPFRLATTFFNHATSFRLRASGVEAPASAAVDLHVDLSDPNAGFPGLCARIRALPLLRVALGRSNAAGVLAAVDFPGIPHDSAAVGRTLYLQAAALDPGRVGLPFVVSNGSAQLIPADPRRPVVAHAFRYTPTSGPPVVVGPRGGGIVIGLDL